MSPRLSEVLELVRSGSSEFEMAPDQKDWVEASGERCRLRESSPLHKLRNDFPMQPPLMGNLVPQTNECERL